MTPDFDELVGREVEGAERERLLRVHALLLEAGPPPEIEPSLAAGPTLAMTIRARRPVRRRVGRGALLLAAAVAVLALAFLGGYITGNDQSTTAARTLELAGTPAAPHALASLQIEPVDAAGNWPMKLSVEGLPALPKRSYYEVFLVRGGKPWASCGTFVVAHGNRGTTVQLNAPYHLRAGDSWVVTRVTFNGPEPGQTVLKPTI
jgi:Anti-sigma-K factor rskA, C-terminal